MNDPTLFESIVMLVKGLIGLYIITGFAITFLVENWGHYANLAPELEPIVTSRLDILPHYVFNYLKASDIYVATYKEGILVDIKRFILDPSLVHSETSKYWRVAIHYRPPSILEGVHIFDLDYPNKKHIRFYARIPAQPDACPFELDPMNTPIPKELLPPEWQVEPLTELGEPVVRMPVYPPDPVFRHYTNPPALPTPPPQEPLGVGAQCLKGYIQQLLDLS